MGYQMYVADLSGEVRFLMLALLRIKAEQGSLEPGEEELLARLKEGKPPPEVQRRARVGARSGRTSQSQE